MRPKRINLALQGGGAHGAFTWGVLDRLLQDEALEIAAISGTSAGALNGAAVKAGLVRGGREAARENLDWLWSQMGANEDEGLEAWFTAMLPGAAAISRLIEASAGFQFADTASRMLSPYMYGPIYENPLQRIVERFHYDDLRADAGPALFVGATNVRTGRIRVFQGDELCPAAILASACLPTLFKAVEVVDPATGCSEAYWDGGYSGNPPLFPLFDKGLPDDIVIVNINPLERRDVPTSPQDIRNRINEVSFNAALLNELRAIRFVKRLIAEGRVERGAMKDVLVHMIADDALMNDLSVATKMIPVPHVLAELKAAGRRAATRFLDLHEDRINADCSVDLEAMFS